MVTSLSQENNSGHSGVKEGFGTKLFPTPVSAGSGSTGLSDNISAEKAFREHETTITNLQKYGFHHCKIPLEQVQKLSHVRHLSTLDWQRGLQLISQLDEILSQL